MMLGSILDLEEYVENCKRAFVCPYLCAQANSNKADVILTPYTYIIDPRVRSNLPSGLFRNNVLIFDEAHNFPEQCCDYFTGSASLAAFQETIRLLLALECCDLGELVHAGMNIDLVALAEIAPKARKLGECFDEIPANGSEFVRAFQNGAKYVQKTGTFIYSFFDRSVIGGSDIRAIIRLITSMSENHSVLGISVSSIELIESVSAFLQTLFPMDKRDLAFIDEFYCVCLTSDYVFHLLCFSPAIAFRQILALQPFTIIMTSGTIAPFQSFVDSLNIGFDIVLENPHVAEPSQLYIAIASRNREHFHFTYQNRTNERMKQDFSSCFHSIFNIVSAGVLLFFPSFSALEDLSVRLRSDNSGEKPILVEPRDRRFLQTSLQHFKAVAQTGAALFAVCRGKMSEGIDFSDDFARCVCLVGIPFPNLGDFKVELHRKWLDAKSRGSGSRWYTEMAMRAVNQAIGRAIRHKDDYAVVILFDERYAGFQTMLSRWIRPSIAVPRTWAEIEAGVRAFFERRREFVQRPADPIPQPAKLPKRNTVFQITPDYPPEDPYEFNFTRSQLAIVAPQTSKALVASTQLHIKMDKSERDRLCLILRRFKKEKDLEILRDGLQSLSSDECRGIVLKAMSDHLQKHLLDSSIPAEQDFDSPRIPLRTQEV
jgi:regulator of telomere elongation helicase 1